jgi:hypothetical protein
MVLRRTLPADLLEGGSKEAIWLGAGFLSTLAALVIGLMIASAKNTYDNQNSNIRQLGTNAVLVDQMDLEPSSAHGAADDRVERTQAYPDHPSATILCGKSRSGAKILDG